jgi:hypothetical protein
MTDKFYKIRKCLEVFLPSYALASHTHRDLLERTTISTLIDLIKLTPSSVLFQVIFPLFTLLLFSFFDFNPSIHPSIHQFHIY